MTYGATKAGFAHEQGATPDGLFSLPLTLGEQRQ